MPNKSAKVTANQISPASQRLGVQSKKHMVVVTATRTPYPGPLNRLSHAADVIKEAANAAGADGELLATWERLQKCPNKWQKLLIWASFLESMFLFGSV